MFAVQTELAQTIVEQLSGQLTDGAADPAAKAAIQAQVQAAEKGGTKNVEAHQHYLQGRFFSNRHSEKSAGDALAEYQRAVELDPSFALAWAGLADTHLWYCKYATEGDSTAFDARSGRTRGRLRREPWRSNPTCRRHCAPARDIQLSFDFDWKGAAETLRTALALAPADPAIVTDAGTLALAKGDAAQGMVTLSQGGRVGPGQPAGAVVSRIQPRPDRAICRGASGVSSSDRVESASTPWSHAGLGLSFLLQGKFEEAAVEATKRCGRLGPPSGRGHGALEPEANSGS